MQHVRVARPKTRLWRVFAFQAAAIARANISFSEARLERALSFLEACHVTPALDYPQIAARVFDQPLLIEQRKLQAILRVLSPRMGFSMMEDDDVSAAPALLPPAAHEAQMAGRKAERMAEGHYVVGSVAVVPVIGTLVQRGGYIGYSGMTSYDAIERMFVASMNDAEVESVLLELDSPGGSAAGAFDLADRIYNARGKKPITAVASEFAASAAYLIGSAADELVLPRTGDVGSIGVVTAHVDYSAALKNQGIAVTFVHAGDKKVDGNPYEPLSKRAKGDLQADVNKLYGMFVDAVASHRNLSAEAVRGTQAGMYMGDLAIAAGLADRLSNFGAEFDRALAATAGKSRGVRISTSTQSNTTEKSNMSDSVKADAEKAAAEARETELAKARSEGHAAGMSEGATAERARIQAIVNHEDAQGRSDLAAHLAFETDMAAEVATSLLGKSPKGAAASSSAGAGSLAEEMAAGGPGIGQLSAGQDDAPGSVRAPSLSHTAIYARRNSAAKQH